MLILVTNWRNAKELKCLFRNIFNNDQMDFVLVVRPANLFKKRE